MCSSGPRTTTTASTSVRRSGGGSKRRTPPASSHSVEAVYNELASSDDDLARWVKDHRSFFRPLTADAVAPTLTETPGLEEGLAAYREVGLDDVMEQMALRMPLRRNAVPDDIARVVFFCASDLAMLMTGSTILVDAGDVAV
jgi:NAD(P)-dependent dehydrogenase (short-subunit alcohol dehydrogenase family)